MNKVFSTADVHPRDRYDYWHEILCKKIIEHDCMPECRQTLRAELQAGAVADIGLLAYETSPMNCYSTVRHVSHANAEELFVVRQGAGVIVIEQDGREVILEAGEDHIGRSAKACGRKVPRGFEAADSQGSTTSIWKPASVKRVR